MSDPLHHECGVAAIRLLKPLAYFADKYGSPDWAFNKLFLLMEKQHNRGQDGAGIGCIKLGMPLGEPYVFRARDATSSALANIFSTQQRSLRHMRERGEIGWSDAESYKKNFNFGGEILMGHLRYGTSGLFDEGSCHPYLRRTNWETRTLMLLGNFNMTNAPQLNRSLIERGQHPIFGTDTQTVLEEIGFYLDEAHTDIYRELRDTMPGRDIPREISKRLDLYDIIGKASQAWDGGFCILGGVGNGDFFCLRDPHGIRPCHYIITDEYIAIASERVPLMSVMEVESEQVHELPRANMIVVKSDGKISIREYTKPLEPTPCSFEAIYFSRGNDPIIYRERKALGAELTEKIVASIEGDISKAAVTYIPNTAEVSYYGLLEGLRSYRRERITADMIAALREGRLTEEMIEEQVLRRWPRAEKIVHKDIKLRTFITQETNRGQMVSQVYDLTYGAIAEDEVLVAIDDSIVRGTTLKTSLLRLLGRAKPRKIVIASSAPQIRYPDCYGIDMSELGKFIAFQAAISLLKKRGMYDYITSIYEECKHQLTLPPEERGNPVKKIYAPFTDDEITNEVSRLVTPDNATCPVQVIYQTLEGLHRSIEGPCGDWYFSGNYPTPGGYTTVNAAFINWFDGRDGRSYSLPV
ncbi:MAG TPA: amidophosphoribosyltransferase [Candidatus Akkermansia intestinigallinarum]|uniref:Amidophosphoribosyltransferase n=1 Tax=Candidatus Akkermansia intestinigallinarum TaxID=2838431 RepID=A0A9D1VB31_9BACT|nr:amidophosphoribosyltransferase [Candidatus Akkermansia intestinigallinarum]